METKQFNYNFLRLTHDNKLYINKQILIDNIKKFPHYFIFNGNHLGYIEGTNLCNMHLFFYIERILKIMSWIRYEITEKETKDFIELFTHLVKNTNIFVELQHCNKHGMYKEFIDQLNNISEAEIIYRDRAPFLNFVWQLQEPSVLFENSDIVRQIVGFL